MSSVRLFRNGQSQAVRIPKSMEFTGVDEVEIERVGDSIILRPARKDWLSFADNPETADPDFMKDRPEMFTVRDVKLERGKP